VLPALKLNGSRVGLATVRCTKLKAANNNPYRFDDFLNDFNSHKNIVSPNYKIPIDDLKNIYFEILIEEFILITVNDMNKRNDTFTSNEFRRKIRDFFAKNGIKPSFFDIIDKIT
jgi:hypothetical protein